MRVVVGGLHLRSGLMYRLISKNFFFKKSVAKPCMGGERVWFSMGL